MTDKIMRDKNIRDAIMANEIMTDNSLTKCIRKAVFPVAGMGTRFLPATKASPKEMMPIVDKPLIQYAVEEAINSGITELIFVTSSSKRSIEDHFDSNFELETKLSAKGDEATLKIVRNVLPEGVTCIYIRQHEALGLGHAVLCAKSVIGDEPFAILLADDLIDEPNGSSCLDLMIKQYEKVNASLVGVEQINLEDSNKYGIVGLNQPFNRFGRITKIVEKPKSADAPSKYAVVGRYILTSRIFKHLEEVKPGRGGEIQLTDAIAALLAEEDAYAFEFPGRRYDCGSKLGYLQAIVSYGLKHAEVGNDFKHYLNSMHENVIELA